MIQLLFGVLTFAQCILAELSCSGCQDPVVGLTVWTDNSTIWRCEKMNRDFLDSCRDTAQISCGRKEFLGGSLYVMTFPESPETNGIKPDHVRKTKGSTVHITMNCVDGQWKIRSRNRSQTHILCDQFITEENRPGFAGKTNGAEATAAPEISTVTAGGDDMGTYTEVSGTAADMTEASASSPAATEPSVATEATTGAPSSPETIVTASGSTTTPEVTTISVATTTSSPIPYDFADLIYPVDRKAHRPRKSKSFKKISKLRNIQIHPRFSRHNQRMMMMRDGATSRRKMVRRTAHSQSRADSLRLRAVPKVNTPKYVPFRPTTERPYVTSGRYKEQ